MNDASSSRPAKSKATTIGASSAFDPDRLWSSWDPTHVPQNNDLRTAVVRAFGLKQTDDYVYHAIASVTLSQVQVAIDHGNLNGMHAWYRDEAGQQISPPSQADIEAYIQIFAPTTSTAKALAAFAGNAKKGSLRASIAQHIQGNLLLPTATADSALSLPAKQKTNPLANPYLDFWAWSCKCLEWAGPDADTVRVKQSHHILPIFYHHFGCVCPSYDALVLIQQLARPAAKRSKDGPPLSPTDRPVVDIGSGNGYWTFLLRRLGLTVFPVDNALSAWRTTWVPDTIQADAVTFLKKPQAFIKASSSAPAASPQVTPGAANAILLLVYPQVSNDFTAHVINAYKGDHIVVAGTQNGNGFTGFAGETVAQWMEREQSEFDKVAQVPLPSFAGKDEALFIFDQKPDPVNLDRHEAIKTVFDFAWHGYYQYAFPHDELKPLSNSPGYSRNDWGATAVDALGTAILMEKTEAIKIVLGHVKPIDLNSTNSGISMFESTIRYMGGLLSAYELLTGPFVSLNTDLGDLSFLVDKAKDLAEVLSAAFLDENSLPSSVLEWTKLSDLTQDSKYGGLAQKAEDVLLNPQPKSAEPFPGFVGTNVDIVTGYFEPGVVTWGGSADSFYEYLLKTYLYDVNRFPQYRERWVAAADLTIDHLASAPAGHPDITFLGEYDVEAGVFVPLSGHMECFAGGNFLLGGLALQEQKYTSFGLQLINGCHHTYISTKTGIGPEEFMWIPLECGKTTPPWKCDAPPSKEAKDLNDRSGFWITESSYNFRPEVIESYYSAYRVTKNEMYREWAWEAWKPSTRRSA